MIIKMKKGYTLLETVVYVSILAVIAVLTLESIVTMYRAYGKTKIERQIATSGEVAIERMVREIRSATSTKTNSVFKTHPGTLALSTGETFTFDNGILRVQEGVGNIDNLTSNDVAITNLIFYATTSPNSTLIKIEMTVEAGAGILLKSRKFYGSAVMRSAY